MRVSSEDNEDQRGLLSERWQEKDAKDTNKEDAKQIDWKTVVACILCFLCGIGLATFTRPATLETCAHDHVDDSNKTTKVVASSDTKTEGDNITELHNMHTIHFPTNIPITFEPNEIFSNASDPEIDNIWEKLLPDGRGFIQIDDDGKAIHYHGEKQNITRTKVVATFHQLHCLNMLRKSLYASVSDPDTFRYLVPQLSIHWTHCFDYLRQIMMCNTDLTLEGLKKQGGSFLTEVDGWGTEHKCKDFGKVFEWAEMHRATDDKGID